jgi:hypothetical protein
MTHARLTHPTRPTIEFRGGQQSEQQREAVANVTNELATDRTPLVHTETRDVRVSERGTATGRRRAANDPDTSDARQALANYAVELEAHVDEFQGDPGYAYVADQTDTETDAVLESVEWSLTPGRVYELDYEASIVAGRSTFAAEGITPEAVSVGPTTDPMLRVDGVACPGMRDYRVATSIGVEVNAVFNRETAENNDVIPQEGRQRQVSFEGVHTGPRDVRATADAALNDLLATKENVTLETTFPGYSMEGFVVGYSSTFSQNRSFDDATDGAHQYRLEFVEGQRA